MIITLTPNPSLDLLFRADRLVWDDANRVPPPRRRPGGQGINLVRALRAMAPEAPALAVAPLGGPVGREMRDLLEAEGTPLRAVEVAGETRVFVGVRECDTGRSLLFNPRGPTLDDRDSDALLGAVAEALDPVRSGWLVCCGSLPPGLPVDTYARAAVLARDRGFGFVADCDGDALAAAAPLCDLLAPNGHEAGRLVGVDVTDAGSALEAASLLRERGVPLVAITLGELGAVALSADGGWWARPAPPPGLSSRLAEGSAVGAGDAFLAALLLEVFHGSDLAAALRLAVAAGTATLLSRDADLVRPADVDTVLPWVTVERLVPGAHEPGPPRASV